MTTKKELEEKAKRLEVELAGLKETINGMKDDAPVWPPVFEDGADYWFIGSHGGNVHDSWFGTANDKYRLKWGNAFPTEHEAQLESKRVKLTRCAYGPKIPSPEELRSGVIATLFGTILAAGDYEPLLLRVGYSVGIWHPTEEAARKYVRERNAYIEEASK